MSKIVRRVLPVALVVGAALASPAAANHSPCEAAGGFTLRQLPPLGTNVCVLSQGGTIMVGVDAVHLCGTPCTVVGARVEVTTNPTTVQVCSGNEVLSIHIFEGCVL